MAEERVLPIALHQEMQRSTSEVRHERDRGPALPDGARNMAQAGATGGRLFAMQELGTHPRSALNRKVGARVVGDVARKYIPTATKAVYDALVRDGADLLQPFTRCWMAGRQLSGSR